MEQRLKTESFHKPISMAKELHQFMNTAKQVSISQWTLIKYLVSYIQLARCFNITKAYWRHRNSLAYIATFLILWSSNLIPSHFLNCHDVPSWSVFQKLGHGLLFFFFFFWVRALSRDARSYLIYYIQWNLRDNRHDGPCASHACIVVHGTIYDAGPITLSQIHNSFYDILLPENSFPFIKLIHG